MIRLLKLEWLKFKSNSVIKLLLGLFVILFPIIILAGKDLFKEVPPPLPSNIVFYEFPTVWEYQGYVGNWMISLMVGFIGIFIVTNEVSFKTLRQNIIIGMTRKEYFTGKVLVITAISLLASLLYAVSTIAIGLAHTPGSDLSLVFDNNWAILKFFLMSMGYLSFGMMIGFVVRRSGIAIFLYMTYIMLLETVIKFATIGIVGWRFEKEGLIKDLLAEGSPILNAINFLPINTIEDLHPMPLFRTADNFINLNDEINFSVLLSDWQAIIGASIYIILFLFIAYNRFMKKDI